MTNQLLILGAGGFGREVLQWAEDAGFATGDWRIRGFLDDNPAALAAFPDLHVPVIGGIADYRPEPGDQIVCALGEPSVKQRLVGRLLAAGARFTSLIHPGAVIGRRVRLGAGCVVCPGAILTADIEIGDFVTINCLSTVGHDARIGSWSTLSGHCDITGGVPLGEGVFVGSHASVVVQAVVGDWAVVGAGSMVLNRVAPKTTVIGVPARLLGGGDIPLPRRSGR